VVLLFGFELFQLSGQIFVGGQKFSELYEGANGHAVLGEGEGA
jgi:hypothetical protein